VKKGKSVKKVDVVDEPLKKSKKGKGKNVEPAPIEVAPTVKDRYVIVNIKRIVLDIPTIHENFFNDCSKINVNCFKGGNVNYLKYENLSANRQVSSAYNSYPMLYDGALVDKITAEVFNEQTGKSEVKQVSRIVQRTNDLGFGIVELSNALYNINTVNKKTITFQDFFAEKNLMSRFEFQWTAATFPSKKKRKNLQPPAILLFMNNSSI